MPLAARLAPGVPVWPASAAARPVAGGGVPGVVEGFTPSVRVTCCVSASATGDRNGTIRLGYAQANCVQNDTGTANAIPPRATARSTRPGSSPDVPRPGRLQVRLGGPAVAGAARAAAGGGLTGSSTAGSSRIRRGGVRGGGGVACGVPLALRGRRRSSHARRQPPSGEFFWETPGVILDSTDPMAEAPTRAIHSGDLTSLRRLLDERHGLAAVRIRRRTGTLTPLHLAADWPGYFPQAPAAVRMIVQAGGEVNARAEGRPPLETPLHWAASSDDVEVADALMDAGADTEAAGGSIGTPLDNALGYGCWHVARSLAERGARVDKLWHAAALGMTRRVEELLAVGPAPGQETSTRRSGRHATAGSSGPPSVSCGPVRTSRPFPATPGKEPWTSPPNPGHEGKRWSTGCVSRTPGPPHRRTDPLAGVPKKTSRAHCGARAGAVRRASSRGGGVPGCPAVLARSSAGRLTGCR